MQKLGIDAYLCPVNRNFSVQGNSLSDEGYLYLELTINKCTSGCPADINDVLPLIQIESPFVNSFFDFDDYNDPVKNFIDGRLSSSILPGYNRRSDVFVQ